MPIRYYSTPDHKMVAIKPWAVPKLREMSSKRREPMVKIITDAVEHYSQLQLSNSR